jgi:pimeloyl-ACP methyl ester carboxylesterase
MQTTTSKDGTVIAFDRSGEGPALILVGGATADRSGAVEIAGVLAKDFTVYAYDRRGRGESGDTLPYAVEREIEDIDALIAEAGGSAFVFGGSSGAVLALRAAAAGLAIPKLAVYEPPFIVDGSRPMLPSDYVTHLNELIAEGRRGDAVEYFMTAAVLVPPEMVAGMRNAPMWPGMERVAHTVPYDGAIMGDTMSGRPEPIRRFAAVTVATLVMDGGASPDWMRHGVQALVAVLPDARYRTLAGQDHGPASAVLAPELVSFFKGE